MGRRRKERDPELYELIQVPDGHSEDEIAQAFVDWLRIRGWQVTCTRTTKL